MLGGNAKAMATVDMLMAVTADINVALVNVVYYPDVRPLRVTSMPAGMHMLVCKRAECIANVHVYSRWHLCL